MAMDDTERARLGERIRKQRKRVFGTRRAAYNAAQVHQFTWTKAEEGEPIREDRLAQIVRALWPETEGDWTLIDAGAAPTSLEERVLALEDRVQSLEEHLARLFDEHDDAERALLEEQLVRLLDERDDEHDQGQGDASATTA